MKLKEISIENRPRERLISSGVNVLSDSELLAVLFQSGYKGENVIDMSNRLISEYSLEKLNSLSLYELMKIKGIGKAKACKILSAFELSKRVRAGRICEKRITCSEDIAKYYMEKMRDYKREHLIAVFLDTKNKIIGEKVISIGTVDSSLVHPREVFKEAIKCSASAIILVHNHPSGDCEASEEDIKITKRVNDAGKIFGIELLDHIIIGKKEFYSINI